MLTYQSKISTLEIYKINSALFHITIFKMSVSSFSPVSSQLILQEAFVLLTVFIPTGGIYPITIYLFLIYEDILTYQNKGEPLAVFSLKLLEGRDENRRHHACPWQHAQASVWGHWAESAAHLSDFKYNTEVGRKIGRNREADNEKVQLCRRHCG